jgi:hypothetical protein
MADAETAHVRAEVRRRKALGEIASNDGRKRTETVTGMIFLRIRMKTILKT